MALQLTDISPVQTLLSHPPLGLVTDIDGTLAPIVARPEDARLFPGCRSLLQDLQRRGVRLAAITGRTLEAARSILGLEGVAYGANQGITLFVDSREETDPAALAYAPLVRRAMAELEPRIAGPGVVMEDKGTLLTVHYRLAPDPQTAREAILAAIATSPASRAFQVHEGRRAIELRPAVRVSKGTAMETLVERLKINSVLCLGDDTTDIDMFRAARRLREEGWLTLTVAVRNPEAPPELLREADYWVEGVDGVKWLLEALLTVLPAPQP